MFNRCAVRTPYDPHHGLTERLLRGVWGFRSDDKIEKRKAAACFYHYENLLNNRHLLDEKTGLRESMQQSADVSALVSILKSQSQRKLSDIHAHLSINAPDWILDSGDEETIDNVLRFAARLWLFTKPDLSDKSRTLEQSVQVPLSKINGASNSWLWLDFSAAMLEKRGGFRIHYTSDIAEHLTFASRYDIRVFAHSCVLERYNLIQAVERHDFCNGFVKYPRLLTSYSKFYPPGLLNEYLRSMNLLWPMEDYKTARRVVRIEAREFVDIEASMGYEDKYDLRTYQIFGERLAKIQERFEIEEQRKGNTLSITIAIWGIALTALFGLVSAVTGLVSTWASLR